MKQIKFSKNWGGKLNCDNFTTIRLYNPDKFVVGEEYEILLCGNLVATAELVSLREITLSDISEEMARLDSGESRANTIKILQEIYPDITRQTKLHYALFLKNNAILQKAYQIANKAHEGQTDKSGAPYIGHVERVSAMGQTIDEKIVGMLHDLVEDTDWTLELLQAEGFTPHIIEVLQLVTKLSEDEPYDEFIERIATNPLAVAVKLNDLRDNMDVTRLSEITDRDVIRMRKYLKAYKRLRQCE